MTDTQKKLLMYGLPVVVLLGLFAWYRSRNASSSTATGSGTVSGATTAGDTAVGLGQLADFENAIQAQIASLSQSSGQSGTTSPTPLPTAPAPVSTVGSGIFYGGGTNETVTTAQGTFEYLSNPQAFAGLPTGSLYYSPVPGYFAPVPGVTPSTPGGTLAPGTPAYVKTG